ncbi:SAF domain-containing protein [Paenibacillus psychroresistens]|uniref:SAF domain-containing protein n=1 Tax=Paenibacillus psychroresistens TaxID=1778678 RepID=UPI001390EBF2|nr:SAF domain-containing protein [Paenibacillus psychroresistens]
MNKRKWVAYVMGLLMICFSLYFYYQFTDEYQTKITTMRTLKPLRPLQAGEVITNDNVQNVLIPVSAHDSNALIDIDAIRGKKLKVPLSTGEEFTAWKLADAILAPRPDQRYYAFKTDALQNVSNMIRRGDRVDVWVEFDKPRHSDDLETGGMWIGSVKLLENLLVADVKSAEGIEISDAYENGGGFSALNVSMLHNQEPDLNLIRASPNAKPELNTYIMNEAEYNVYVIGALAGKIKLSLANIMVENGGDSRISEQYLKYQGTEIFNKDLK